MHHDFLQITLISLKIASLAVLVILLPGLGFGYAFSRWRFPGKTFLETLVYLPVVLPPVATGLILLYALAPDGVIGMIWQQVFRYNPLLTQAAAVVAGAVVAFPLLVKSLQQGFTAIDPDIESLAQTLGKSRPQVFLSISLPLVQPAMIQGCLLAFARVIGEFGATMLVAGLIPGETETLALGIYSRILAGEDDKAWVLVGIAAAITFSALLLSRSMENRRLVN